MIVDKIEHSHFYSGLHPLFARAFDFLSRPDLATLPDEKIVLDGTALFALPQSYITKPLHEGQLETHQQYIDIQYVVSGTECIGYAPSSEQEVTQPYNAASDVAFYCGESSAIKVSSGMFAIFYPHDLHLPGRYLEASEQVKKIVIKVRVT